MEIKNELESIGKVLNSGHREEQLWFDLDTTTPLTKENYISLEKKFEAKKKFVKVINAGSALDKESGKEVQRIWLVAFDNKKDLDKWTVDYSERMTRDHRFIGEQCDWFHIQEDIVGQGLPLFHPKGMIIKNKLIELMREVNGKLGCEEVGTPHIAKATLWKMSGHYKHYRDKMFIWEQEGEEWGIKAMNCPLHIQIYRFKPRSYKDLPIRYAEFAMDYRKEQSGELHGISRTWAFTQDDHHFIVTPEQIQEEVIKIIKASQKVYALFGFEYKIKLATKPDNAMGSQEFWDKAEKGLKEALKEVKVEYEIEEGDGSFYGPKIDVYVKDNMARWWQLTTIQTDFFMPENFKMSYVDTEGKHQRPVMVHFAVLGSLERFMSVIIESSKGRLPLWLSPEQLRVLPINDDQKEYAQNLVNDLRASGIRAAIDSEGTLNKRIRNAELNKVALIAVVGKREVENETVSVRTHKGIQMNIQKTKTGIKGKTIDYPKQDFKEKLLLADMERSEF